MEHKPNLATIGKHVYLCDPHCKAYPHLSTIPRKFELKPPTKNTQAWKNTHKSHKIQDISPHKCQNLIETIHKAHCLHNLYVILGIVLRTLQDKKMFEYGVYTIPIQNRYIAFKQYNVAQMFFTKVSNIYLLLFTSLYWDALTHQLSSLTSTVNHWVMFWP